MTVEPNGSTNRPLRSGELARIAGVSGDTVRYYERLRLLPAAPRSASGYRLFPPESIVRIQLIRSALSIGFSTRELREILGERDRGAPVPSGSQSRGRETHGSGGSAPRLEILASRITEHAHGMGRSPAQEPARKAGSVARTVWSFPPDEAG